MVYCGFVLAGAPTDLCARRSIDLKKLFDERSRRGRVRRPAAALARGLLCNSYDACSNAQFYYKSPPSPRVAHLTKASRRTVGRKRRECTADKPKRARPCGGVSMVRVLRRRTEFGAVAGRGVGLGIGKLPAELTFITAECWVSRGSSEGRARRRPRRSARRLLHL